MTTRYYVLFRSSFRYENGCDIASDWGYFTNDPDGYNAALEAFDAEAFA